MPPLIVGEKSITKDLDGIIRVDDINVFRIVEHDGKPFVQIKDYNRQRIKCRHSYFVEIPMEIFIARLIRGTCLQEPIPPDEVQV
jgi:hypothetical protein